MLKFIGTGSAFNTELGNNSAYYKKDEDILIIDCGSDVFSKIKKYNILDGIKNIHVLITHTHSDHVGSLADLILYSYYSHGDIGEINLTTYSCADIKLKDLLKLNGCTEGVHYNNVESKDIKNNVIAPLDFSFYFFKTNHVNDLNSYSLELSFGDYCVYYSGDSNELDDLTIKFMDEGAYSRLYVDTCSMDCDGDIHLPLSKLADYIKPKDRGKVWCMHLDEKFDIYLAKYLGFNVVESEFK